jgi:hypothetical protein
MGSILGFPLDEAPRLCRLGPGDGSPATGLAGLTFLQCGQVVLEEAYISVYGAMPTGCCASNST